MFTKFAAADLQQQKTTLLATSVSQEQQTEATVHMFTKIERDRKNVASLIGLSFCCNIQMMVRMRYEWHENMSPSCLYQQFRLVSGGRCISSQTQIISNWLLGYGSEFTELKWPP